MIAATLKLAQDAAELDEALLSSLYRMCVLELNNLIDDETALVRVRERLGAALN